MQYQEFYVTDTGGRALAGAYVTVYLAGTDTYAPLFKADKVTPLENPFRATAGGLAAFAAVDGEYDVRMQLGALNIPPIRGMMFYDGMAMQDTLRGIVEAGKAAIDDEVHRGIRAPDGERFTLAMPSAAERAGKIVAFNADGEPTVMVPAVDSSLALALLLAQAGGGSTIGMPGGETVADALKRANPYRASSIIDLCIMYGQSNKKGHADNSAGDPTYKTPLARCFDGTAFIPLTNYAPTSNDTDSTGGTTVAFANQYCQRTGRKLALLNCAKDSQSLADLSKGTTNYTNMLAWVAAAKGAIIAEGNTVGEVFFDFEQGERDSQLKTTATAYMAGVTQLWTDAKADTGATRFFISTVGYYADSSMIWGQTIQQVQRLFARNNIDVVLAYDDLGSYGSHNQLKVDAVHLNQRGYNIWGRELADRTVDALFPDTGAPANDQTIQRYGRLNMQQSQSWNLHAGVIQKLSAGQAPNWMISHTSPRSHSFIKTIDTSDDTTLNVELACPARTIASYSAYFGGTLGAAGVRAEIGTGLTPSAIIAPVNADGVSVLPIKFFATLYIRVNMVAQTIDILSMGSTLASLLNEVSATWDSPGICTLNYPAPIGLPTATISGSVARLPRVNASGSSAVISLRDASDALVDDVFTFVLPNMPVKHVNLPYTCELSVQMIAADYAPW